MLLYYEGRRGEGWSEEQGGLDEESAECFLMSAQSKYHQVEGVFLTRRVVVISVWIAKYWV